MARYFIPLLLAAAVFAGCAGEPSGGARDSDGDERTTRAARPAETTADRPASPETTARSAAAGSAVGSGVGSAGAEYITIGESESVEGGVRSAQVIVTAKRTSEPALRRIVEDLKEKHQDRDLVNVEIMDGPAGFGRAGTATIANTPAGARAAGLPRSVAETDGYVLEVVD